MEDKFEREIEDILNRLDKFPRRGPTYRARRALSSTLTSLHQNIAARMVRLSLSQVMLTGIVLIFVGYFFRAALSNIWYYIVVSGLILFFAAFFISFLGGRRTHGAGQIYWRGRPASAYSSPDSSLAERLLDWCRRRLRRSS